MTTTGTLLVPRYGEGPAEFDGDVGIHQREFTYATSAGTAAGVAINLMFTIDRPAKDVWPYLKDFNKWQNPYHTYSGVIGDLYSSDERDLGADTFRITRPDGTYSPYSYQVLRVIPEYLLVIHQPVPDDGSTGGIGAGFHVFMLNEHGGKTVVTGFMEHAKRTTDTDEERVLAHWREQMPEWQRKWRDIFIPTLKKLVYASA